MAAHCGQRGGPRRQHLLPSGSKTIFAHISMPDGDTKVVQALFSNTRKWRGRQDHSFCKYKWCHTQLRKEGGMGCRGSISGIKMESQTSRGTQNLLDEQGRRFLESTFQRELQYARLSAMFCSGSTDLVWHVCRSLWSIVCKHVIKVCSEKVDCRR